VTAESRSEPVTGRWSVEGKTLTLSFGENENSRPFTFYQGQLVFRIFRTAVAFGKRSSRRNESGEAYLHYRGVCLAGASIAKSHADSDKSVTGAQVDGTWKSKGGEFKIWALGKQRLQIEFSGVYEYKTTQGPMANEGEGSGIATIEGETAIFKPEGSQEECQITFKFTDSKLVVTSAPKEPTRKFRLRSRVWIGLKSGRLPANIAVAIGSPHQESVRSTDLRSSELGRAGSPLPAACDAQSARME
jgi:hypothetical protein